MMSSLANKDIHLRQCANALLQEERVPVGPSNQELLECPQTRVVPQQCLQQFISALRRQRIDAELGVIRFASPTMLVLRPIVWDFNKLLHIPGLSFNIGGAWSTGKDLSARYIGNSFTVQS